MSFILDSMLYRESSSLEKDLIYGYADPLEDDEDEEMSDLEAFYWSHPDYEPSNR